MLPNTATDNLKSKDDYPMENKDQKFDKKEYDKQYRNEDFKQIAYRYRCASCGTPTKRKAAVCIVDIAVFTIIHGKCFFDERHIPFYLIPILFVICQLTYLILSAIINRYKYRHT